MNTSLRKAWLTLAGLPVGLLLAFLGGTLLSLVIGVPEGGRLPDWGIAAMIGLLIVLFGAPAIAAFVFGRQASASGERGAYLPAWIVLAVGVLVVAQNVVASLWG